MGAVVAGRCRRRGGTSVGIRHYRVDLVSTKSDEVKAKVDEILDTAWSTRDRRVVPNRRTSTFPEGM